MLKVIPKSLFSWEFLLLDNEELIGSADYAWFDGCGWLVLQKEKFMVNAGNNGNGPFELFSLNNGVAGTTCKYGLFQDHYRVFFDGVEYILKQASPLRRNFEVMSQDTYLGCILPEATRSRAASTNVSESVPLFIRAFLIGLALNIWAKQTAGVDVIV